MLVSSMMDIDCKVLTASQLWQAAQQGS
jgi:hypothetical protein